MGTYAPLISQPCARAHSEQASLPGIQSRHSKTLRRARPKSDTWTELHRHSRTRPHPSIRSALSCAEAVNAGHGGGTTADVVVAALQAPLLRGLGHGSYPGFRVDLGIASADLKLPEDQNRYAYYRSSAPRLRVSSWILGLGDWALFCCRYSL